MHPPFFVVDHKIDTHLHTIPARPVKRRTQPERLDISVSAAAWPPVPHLPAPDGDGVIIRLPTGGGIFQRPQLQIVPPPQRNLRHKLGRWLIRIGQRMILENRPG